jgi:hypothetical protein
MRYHKRLITLTSDNNKRLSLYQFELGACGEVMSVDTRSAFLDDVDDETWKDKKNSLSKITF